jgi:GntR family transcriptional regulator, transcriptional repressor for pyruvate dehydrogenase complex
VAASTASRTITIGLPQAVFGTPGPGWPFAARNAAPPALGYALSMNRVVTSTTLPQSVAEHLRNLIHRGELGPGDRLPPERDLAVQLGIARISLREGIKILRDSGYLEVRRGNKGGVFVTELTKPLAQWRRRLREQTKEIDDIIDYRIALESYAATLAARRRTPADLSEMRRAIRDIARGGSRAAFRVADSQFHASVARAASNVRLENSIHYTRGELFSPHDLLDYAEPVEESRLDHQAIYDAIRQRQVDLAAGRMRDHIERTRDQLRVIVFGDEEQVRSRPVAGHAVAGKSEF